MNLGQEGRKVSGVRLRPIDLARAAGISTQQVRNYAEAGILPPTARTESGYRVFTERHQQALQTFRALLAGYGLPAAQAIMCAVHADDVPAALDLINAGHAELHRQRLSLQDAGAALEAVAAQQPQVLPRGELQIGELAHRLGVRTSALRVWEQAGLLTPERERGTGYRRYRASDIRDAQMVDLLRRSHYPLPQIRPVLDGLRATGSSAELRAAIASRQQRLLARTEAMLAGSSHLHGYLGEPSAAS